MKKLTDKKKSISIILIVSLLIVGFIYGVVTGLSRKNRESVNNNVIDERVVDKIM